MTHSPFPVHVVYKPPHEGGRQTPPQGTYACTTEINGRHWSIVLTPHDTTTLAHFLAPTAPWDTMTPGTALPLYEGPRRVGTATVLEP